MRGCASSARELHELLNPWGPVDLDVTQIGRDDTVGNPRRAQISQFELVELEFINSSFSSLSSY